MVPSSLSELLLTNMTVMAEVGKLEKLVRLIRALLRLNLTMGKPLIMLV